MDPEIDALKRELKALQAAHEARTVDTAAFQLQRQALEQRIVERVLANTPSPPPLPPQAGTPYKLLAGIAAAVLVVAAAGYGWTGTPNANQLKIDAAAAERAAPGGQPGAAQIQAMVDKLAQRLKDKPDDAEGWRMLARSYIVLERPGDAVAAYKKAVALNGNDAGLLADYADALAMTKGRDLTGEPLALVQKALQIDPTNLKALALAGSAAFDQKDFAAAVGHWEKLAAAAPPDSPWLPNVRESIAEARRAAGMPVAAAPTPGPGQPPAQTAAANSATVTGTVSLAAALRAQAAPEDTVFVYARAASGPRMPLAIVRKQVKDLPFDFVLDDSTAMSPALRLSGFQSVVVGARVSKSGNAIPQPGDLAGQSAPLAPGAPGAKGLKLEIATVVTP
jgi:cytochrome c-type biogenesis protein CcmH